MSRSRLSTALDDGLIDLPQGGIVIMRPPATYDVSALPREAITIQHSFYPDAAAWQAAGFPVVQELPQAGTAIVVVPRAKELARQMVAAACKVAGFVIVDGQKTDGADSIYNACRKIVGPLPSLTQAHGRIFWFAATDAFRAWKAAPAQAGPHGFVTVAGVFSDGEIDKGSALLAEALPPKLPERMADLGAGWGYLSHHVLKREGVAHLDLVEAEALALDCARRNVTDPRAKFHWADATRFDGGPYDGIVMNPPFHTGRTPDPSLGRAFIASAARLLAPHGRLWMVANRHLPYETTLQDCFRNVDTIGGNGAFKLVLASKPKR